MGMQRSTYAVYAGLISVVLLGGLLSAGPAQAAPGGVVTTTSDVQPEPAPAPREKVAKRPKAAPDKDLSPRRANV
jgi:hypothetical protein